MCLTQSLRRVLALVAVLGVAVSAALAQQPVRNSIAVAPFSAPDRSLATLATRIRDTVAVRLGADSTWSLIPLEPSQRPRSRVTGQPVPIYYVVFGQVRAVGVDTLVAVWRGVSVETGLIVVRDSVRAARANPDLLVAALARTVVFTRTRRR